jgi:emp24/gp25L/p24 family/GOLD
MSIRAPRRRDNLSKSQWLVGGVLWINVVHIFLIQQVRAIPWIVTMDPYEDACFLYRGPSTAKSSFGKVLAGDYELFGDTRTGDKVSAQPLLVYIMENSKQEGIVWRSQPGASHGTFRIPMSQNIGYWFCVQNSDHGPDNMEPEGEHPDHIARTVGFEVRVESMVPSVKPVPALFTTDHSDEWQARSDEVQEELRAMMHHRDYMRIREADHRALVEKTFASTLTWTLMEAVVVVVMAIGQIFYFRRFLERKTYLSNHRY